MSTANSEDKEFERLSDLYWGLNEEECRFIVTQWDASHGLDSWQERLRKKERAPGIQKRKQIILSISLVIAIFPFSWFVNDYNNAKRARAKLEYIYARAPENRALSAGLKWIDNEIEEMRDSLDDIDPP